MKKNISINISGIIFHIEEDGYESLKKYLDSINKYFSTFDDSSEILADIESRIAEIFLSKLTQEKQVITAEDVQTLIATMGSVSDFKAAEDQEPAQQASETHGPKQEASSQQPRYTHSPKSLYRDQQRKILGGVCAGLGNYLNIDPLWVRLVFALFLFAYGITALVYMVMWIVVPGSYNLEEPVVGKKMFRDPERKVIGGVSGGVAAYFGIEILVVRLLFVILSLVGGLGIFLYIVLWIILPEARTITDKMQMQGEPLTLSNIESNLKKNLNLKEDDESALAKILLFPFRLIGLILSGLGNILPPLFEVARVVIGLLILCVGMTLAISTLTAGGMILGIFSLASISFPWSPEFNDINLPVEAFLRAFPGWVAFAAFMTFFIPSLVIILLGVSVVARRIVFSATVGWTLFALFLVSIIQLAIGIPSILLAFREEGEYVVENTYAVKGKTAVLKLNPIGSDEYYATRLTLRGHEGNNFRLVQSFESQGSSTSVAVENARMITYNVEFVDDSVFYFDRNIQFREDAIFRGQRLNMTLYIPYDFPFIMDEGMSRFITQYVDYEYRDGYTWKMTRDGLKCINCYPEKKVSEEADSEDVDYSNLTDFNKIEISGKFDVRILHGDDYSVEMLGTSHEKNKYRIRRAGDLLMIEYRGPKKIKLNPRDFNIEELRINITLPVLEKIEATGFGTIRFDDFENERLEIDLHGPIDLRGHANTRDLSVRLNGKSEADLSGRTDNLQARVEFASRLDAYTLEAKNAFVEVTGGSKAKVYVTEVLEWEKGLAGKIDYKGNPKKIIKHD